MVGQLTLHGRSPLGGRLTLTNGREVTGKLKALALALLTVPAIGGATASAVLAAEIHIKDMGKATGDATQGEGVEFATRAGWRARKPKAISTQSTN